MAIDKVIDSAQLDAGLTSIADSIRAKGGTSAALTFPGGFAAAVAAVSTGGGTLDIKTGTVTLAEGYSMPKIQHGCGKLPFAVYMYTANNEWKYNATSHVVGCIWLRDAYACTCNNKSNTYFQSNYSYIVPFEEQNPYGPHIDAETLHINPAQKFEAGTYIWTAIYEV